MLSPLARSIGACPLAAVDVTPATTPLGAPALFSVGDCWRGVRERLYSVIALWVAMVVMGFPGAVECGNRIAAYLKDGLHSSP